MHLDEENLRALMGRARIPALSLATLRSGAIHSAHAIGVRGAHDAQATDEHTVFEAASLTKPLVSFIALQLAEEGRLDLQAPLHEMGGEYVAQDPRASAITATHVLTHCSGLPNIVSDKLPLKTYFTPGERYSYGSSAFAWLQRAMEKASGQPLEALARERVFGPCGMAHSSLHWQERFDTNHAQGHDDDGAPLPKRRPKAAAASWSLLTTASDYARFVQAVLCEQGLSARMRELWFTPAMQAREGVDDVTNAQARVQDDVAPITGMLLPLGQHPGVPRVRAGQPAHARCGCVVRELGERVGDCAARAGCAGAGKASGAGVVAGRRRGAVS